MVKSVKMKYPTTAPPVQVASQQGFPKGVITLVDPSKLPDGALARADNLWLSEQGTPTLRPGTAYYGTAPSANALDGAGMYVTSALAPHLLEVAGGVVYRSIDDGATWTACTGATLTAGKKVSMVQANGFMYIVNGTDNMARYDGSTVLQVYSSLSTPTIGSVTKTGLAGTTYTYYYRVSAVNAIGFTIASASASGLIQTDRQRSRFDSSNYVTTTWAQVPGALRYDIFVGDILGQETYIASIADNATPTYIDNGSAPTQVNILAPTQNTTQGPVISIIKYVGDRLWGTGDANNPYRVWWSGSGPYIGYFGTSYDGGYIDLNVGSQFRPTDVEDYRDGKGTPYTTIWCKSADGRGCVWQTQLTTQTVQNIYSYTVPSSYKIPGSRGTQAPYSVVNVLNDFMYYNSQAFYNLGSRAQFLNLLSTDEVSANIRPTVRTINPIAASGICAYYFLAKVYFSVPYGSSTSNNAIIIYDTERKAWLPEAFTYGVERFFEYADTTGTVHLLAWKTGDTKLSEISTSIKGDYGAAFTTYLQTGLIPVSKNRFDFMWVDEGEFEFSQPTGTINIELAGIDRNSGYKTLATITYNPSTGYSSSGWSTKAWSTIPWSQATSGTVYSESTNKRWFVVQRDINAWQYAISTSTIDAGYTLRTLQVTGTPSEAGSPRQWRVQATSH
jgi:hypothetical protein